MRAKKKHKERAEWCDALKDLVPEPPDPPEWVSDPGTMSA